MDIVVVNIKIYYYDLEKIEESNYTIDYCKIYNSWVYCFRGDIITISRDIDYSSNYQESFNNDGKVLNKQKIIRIVRNEEKRGIEIKFRGRKTAMPLIKNEAEIHIPVLH